MSSTPFRRPSLVSIEQSPLQRALENYNEMERDLADCIEKNRQLAVDNGSLIAEVNMLRESLERADGDRIRLQAVSSTLLGRLLSINDCIAGAVRASVKVGIEAAKEDPALERAGAEAQEIIQRVQPTVLPEPRHLKETPPAPPQATGTTLPDGVDWSRLPQGSRA